MAYTVAPHLEYFTIPLTDFVTARPEFEGFGLGRTFSVMPIPPRASSSPARTDVLHVWLLGGPWRRMRTEHQHNVTRLPGARKVPAVKMIYVLLSIPFGPFRLPYWYTCLVCLAAILDTRSSYHTKSVNLVAGLIKSSKSRMPYAPLSSSSGIGTGFGSFGRRLVKPSHNSTPAILAALMVLIVSLSTPVP